MKKSNNIKDIENGSVDLRDTWPGIIKAIGLRRFVVSLTVSSKEDWKGFRNARMYT